MQAFRIAIFDSNITTLSPVPGDSGVSGMQKSLIFDLIRLAGVPYEIVDGSRLSVELYNGEFVERFTACLKMLELQLVDLCPDIYTHSAERTEVARYLTPYVESFTYRGFVWNHGGGDGFRPWAVMRTFDKEVWLGVLAALAVVGVGGLIAVMGRKRKWFRLSEMASGFSDSVMSGFGNLVNQGNADLFCKLHSCGEGISISSTANPILIIWSLAAVVISAFFSGSVYSIASIIPASFPPFRDLRSMHSSGYQFALKNGVIVDQFRVWNNSNFLDKEAMSKVSQYPPFAHEPTHIELKPTIPCDKCGRKFNTLRRLQNHRNRQHVLVQCDKCEKEFNRTAIGLHYCSADPELAEKRRRIAAEKWQARKRRRLAGISSVQCEVCQR